MRGRLGLKPGLQASVPVNPARVCVPRDAGAYPKFRVSYVTDRDAPPSPAAPSTDRRRSTQDGPVVQMPPPAAPTLGAVSPVTAAAAAAAGAPAVALPPTPNAAAGGRVPSADKFSIYLRPTLPLPSSRWAAGWAAAAQQQHMWGGLHVTLCSFAPKLSSGMSGHHGSSLMGVLHALQDDARGCCNGGRWQANAARHALPVWYTRGGLTMVCLPQSGTLRLVAQRVLSSGMVNARPQGDLHLTLGDPRGLPPLPGGGAFPPEGATGQPLAPELFADLCEANWAVVIAKLEGGHRPARDNEALAI